MACTWWIYNIAPLNHKLIRQVILNASVMLSMTIYNASILPLLSEVPHNGQKIQLNEYETAPYFIQLSQNLTLDCLLISVFLPVFAWCDHKIVLFWSAEQFYDDVIQKLVKTKINKQSDVMFWLNWIKYGAVSYSLSCKVDIFSFLFERAWLL